MQAREVRNGQPQPVVKLFDVEDPRGARASLKTGTFDVNMAWALLRQDVLYLDWKARQDVLAIVAAHDKVRSSIVEFGRILRLNGNPRCGRV